MKEQAVVFREGKPFGTAIISIEGLYYRINIRCPEPIRVWIKGGKGRRELGLCVPADTGFVINTRIPVRHLGEGPFSFCVEEKNEKVFPVYRDKPFPYLDKLRNAMLFQEGGLTGVQIVSSKPTGQWSEPNTSE